tara:strand:- start:967 stop:2214 length:1248 start_codon:yes stop_codon:yes gene_type:complete
MSKSPLKQMDSALVSAYRQAQLAGVPSANDGKSQAIDNIGKTAMEAAFRIKANNKAAKQRLADSRKEGEELATKTLDTGGSLDINSYDASLDAIQLLANKHDKANGGGDGEVNKIEADKYQGMLNKIEAENTGDKEIRNSIAGAFGDDADANLIQNLNENDLGLLKARIDPKTEVRMRPDGDEYVSEMKYNGKWYGRNEIQRKFDEAQEDVVSINDIQKLRDVIKTQATEDMNMSTDGNVMNSWDEAETKNKISKILRGGNMVSLANDDILGTGGSFGEDLLNSPQLSNISYDSLGLDPATVARVDGPDGDGMLSPDEVAMLTPEDKAKIVDVYTNPENELYKEDDTASLMEQYLLQHMKSNYDKVNANKPAPTDQGEQMHVQNSDGSYSPVSPASDQFKDLSTEELLAMYPPKQ